MNCSSCRRKFRRQSRSTGVFCFAFTKNAFKGLTREPNKVAAGIEIKRDTLRRVRAKSEGQSVITTWRERKRDLVMVVILETAVMVLEAVGRAGGGGFEEVVGGGEVGIGEGVSEREKKNLRDRKRDV